MTRLIHLHVPKCAGTSLLTILRQWYGQNNVLRTDTPQPQHYGKYNVVSGHFPYDDEFWDHRWFSFVRHPVDRLQSFYFYTKERGKKSRRNYWWNIISKMTLEEWFASDLSKNHILKHFAGKTPHEKLEHKDIDLAYRNSDKFYFIGFQESFSTDINHLAKKLGKPKPSGKVRMLPSKNPGIQDENLYGNDLDFEFYNYLLTTWSVTS